MPQEDSCANSKNQFNHVHHNTFFKNTNRYIVWCKNNLWTAMWPQFWIILCILGRTKTRILSKPGSKWSKPDLRINVCRMPVYLSCLGILVVIERSFIGLVAYNAIVEKLHCKYPIVSLSLCVHKTPVCWGPWRKTCRMRIVNYLYLNLLFFRLQDSTKLWFKTYSIRSIQVAGQAANFVSMWECGLINSFLLQVKLLVPNFPGRNIKRSGVFVRSLIGQDCNKSAIVRS